MKRPLALVLLSVLIVACATSPLGRRQLKFFPSDQLAEMGAAAFQQVEQQAPESTDPKTKSYVTCVADSIVRALPGDQPKQWDVKVFDSPQVNAFALPGGKIGVFSGLLKVARTPDQLAAVIGHEVGHVLADHSNERLSTTYAAEAGLKIIEGLRGGANAGNDNVMALLGLGTQVGVLLPFSRTQETEADIVGLDLMADAGFNPKASLDLWKNMSEAGGAQGPEFLSTHPANEKRMEELSNRMPEAEKRYQAAQAQGRKPQCKAS